MPSISSILRSAEARRAKIRAQEDAEIAFEWERSGQTYQDFQQYSKYLNSRLKSTSDPSDVLSYQRKIQTARRSYTSNEIQRHTQAVIEGRGTVTQKKNLIASLYDQAVSNGDMNLAQNLVSQWDSLDVQEQNQAAAAAAAGERLQNAQDRYAKNVGAGYASIAHSLENELKNLTNAFNRGGQTEYNKASKKFVDQYRDVLKELGVDLPKDYSTNLGQLIQGVARGVGTYYMLASEATELADADISEGYKNTANKIATGETTFETPAGRLNYQQLEEFALSPNLYVQDTDELGKKTLRRATTAGYRIDENGRIIPVSSGSTKTPKLENSFEIEKQLEALGLTVMGYSEERGTYKVKLTGKSNEWLDPGDIGKINGEEFQIVPVSGGFQFINNQRLFNIGIDEKGLGGLFEVGPMGLPKHVSGQYGFNQLSNTAQKLTQQINWKAALQKDPSIALANTPFQKFSSKPARPIPGQNVIDIINQKSNILPGGPRMTQRAGGGFNFTDPRGRPISAYTYSKLTGKSFRNVLSTAASKGDTFAREALKYAGDDAAYNPATVPASVAKNWSSLIWGQNVKLQTPQSTRNQLPAKTIFSR